MITSIVIPNIPNSFTADAIANVLWENNLCRVSRILLVPSSIKDVNIAYIGVEQWCEFIVPTLLQNKPVYIGFDNWTLINAENFIADETEITDNIKITSYSEKYFEKISQALFILSSIN